MSVSLGMELGSAFMGRSLPCLPPNSSLNAKRSLNQEQKSLQRLYPLEREVYKDVLELNGIKKYYKYTPWHRTVCFNVIN